MASLVALAGGAAANGEDTGPVPTSRPVQETQRGWILAPTPDVARTVAPLAGHGVSLFYVRVSPDAPFRLGSVEGSSMSGCLAGQCYESGDFDIVFFDEGEGTSSRVVGRAAGLGDEEGIVPRDADFGLVFLRTPGLQPTARGHGFDLVQGIAGDDPSSLD